MTVRRLSYLQWFGLLAGGTVWFASFILGIWTTQAVCNPASSRWGIPHDTVQVVVAAVAFAFVGAAELAAVTVFRATEGTEEQDPPPEGRLHFFATAAMVANLVFLMIIVLTGIASVVDRACHQA